jgi:glycosyltransferase involved in cell wall biosynthesis
MRIALVARCGDPLGPHSGPAAEAVRVTSLAQALADLGHRVTIYARRDSAALPGSAIAAPGVTVERVTAGPPVPLRSGQLTSHLPEFGRRLAHLCRRNPPDVVHAHSWVTGLAALAGAQHLGVPVAQTFGSLAAAECRHGLSQRLMDDRIRLEACIARRADVILASSTSELEDLAWLGGPRARVRVVPCGVDPQRFSPDGPVAERTARRRLLAAQPATATRSLGLALAALALVPDAELVIMGGTADPELLRTAMRLQVRERLVFTGPVGPDDLPPLLRSADLLVNAAPYEPAGMTALQAMACGTPVVTTAAGAERDSVIDRTTGLHVTPGSPGLLASGIRQLLADPIALEASGIAAADRARSRYSWERIGRETLAAYAQCGRRPDAASRVTEGSRPGRVEARDVRQIPAGAPA